MDIAKKFEEIRDIPYRIPLHSSEPDSSCSGKMKAFKKWLDNNGYQSRYRVCEFKWSDINLPNEVTEKPHHDLSSHVYLEILVGNTWIKIDPTWDKALASVLPINEWNSQKDMIIAVHPLHVYNEEKSREIMEGTFDESDIEKNGEFYNALNNWLEQNRVHA